MEIMLPHPRMQVGMQSLEFNFGHGSRLTDAKLNKLMSQGHQGVNVMPLMWLIVDNGLKVGGGELRGDVDGISEILTGGRCESLRLVLRHVISKSFTIVRDGVHSLEWLDPVELSEIGAVGVEDGLCRYIAPVGRLVVGLVPYPLDGCEFPVANQSNS